jgi:hypothetical protein
MSNKNEQGVIFDELVIDELEEVVAPGLVIGN